MRNALGKEIPENLLKMTSLGVYEGAFAKIPSGRKAGGALSRVKPGDGKVLQSLEEAIIKSGLQDGMTISFHHHFRSGDYILNMVVDVIAKLGIKGLTLASSSLADIHTPLIEHIKQGVITRITTSGLRGALAEEISRGLLDYPVVIRSHGGRARAIEAGDIKIDVAFLGAPSSDIFGNACGFKGKAICGSLGYAQVDARYADRVVIITDDLVEGLNAPASIPQDEVDFVVKVDAVGNPAGIASGATRFTKNPRELLIAEYASKVITNTSYFHEGFSFQTGSGGSSLAVSRFLRKEMLARGITANFALGGITQPMVEMLEEGLIKNLFDVQSFDLVAAESLHKNENHIEINASQYANPHTKGCIANNLDVVILSALEIDIDFNVNVITGSDGVIRGASGGHSDTAAAAKLAIIVVPLVRGRIPSVVERVDTVVTPGSTVDVLVTDRGIAIHPERSDLHEMLKDSGLPICDIRELKEQASRIVGIPEPIEHLEEIVGIVEYRDGSILDLIRRVK